MKIKQLSTTQWCMKKVKAHTFIASIRADNLIEFWGWGRRGGRVSVGRWRSWGVGNVGSVEGLLQASWVLDEETHAPKRNSSDNDW